MTTIAIIDYGMGNLRSVRKAFEHVGHEAVVTRSPRVIARASHIVLPGVGAFPAGMANLTRLGLIRPIADAVASGTPFLGLCLGLQLLFTEGEEFGRHRGLGLLKGRVVRFPKRSGLKVPHMGWNRLQIRRAPPPLRHVPDGSYVYFVHSYYAVPEDKGMVTATTRYGVEFVSILQDRNVVACQFHPEKSQAVGLAILKAFGQMESGRCS